MEKFIYEDWFRPTETNYIIHCGKTGSGKTYNAIQRLKEVGSGVYLAPLRLLAFEIYDKLNSEGHRCNLVTGEEQIESRNAKITSSTIEMLNYSEHHEVVVIDEAFMLGDKDRGKSWLRAIVKSKANEVHIITSEESLDLIAQLLTITSRNYKVVNYEMLQQFKFTESKFVLNSNMPNKGVFVTFSRLDVLLNKKKLENLGKSVSILYGNLPPEVKKKQIDLFISGEAQLMVCTDVIGMGVNVPCDYIVFLTNEKFDGEKVRKLNPTEVRQISGRTGRYGLSSNNSFVSATNNHALADIKQKYETKVTIKKTFLGLDYDMFCALGNKATIKQRISHFIKSDIIPPTLSNHVVKEPVTRYLEIEPIVQNKEFDLATQWAFLTAPVKRNNMDYFRTIVRRYKTDKVLFIPSNVDIMADTFWLENKISEIELFLNLSRNLNHESNEKDFVMDIKTKMIAELDRILLDKKLATKKKCKLCDTKLDITYPHPYCNPCYKEKISYNYDNHDYSFYRHS